MTAGAAPAEPTVIAPTMLIQGEVRSREGIHVRGRLEGILHVNGSRLVIEQGGSVAAMVRAARVVVHGLLLGDTVASSSITVCRDGSLIGEVRTCSLVVEDGAYLKGKIETMPGSELELQNVPDPSGEG
jgi:cytoskeletal protein CcmA (bactofilin family)